MDPGFSGSDAWGTLFVNGEKEEFATLGSQKTLRLVRILSEFILSVRNPKRDQLVQLVIACASR
jgi:hypothetical protein